MPEYTHTMAHLWRQRKLCGFSSLLSPLRGVPGTELGSSGLVASASSRKAISRPPVLLSFSISFLRAPSCFSNDLNLVFLKIDSIKYHLREMLHARMTPKKYV